MLETIATFLDDFHKEIRDTEANVSDPHLLCGHAIANVRTYSTVLDEWLDYSHTFFVLDDGRTIDLPVTNSSVVTRKVHPHAKPLEGEMASLLIGQKIADVIEQSDRNDEEKKSVILELSNRHYAWENAIAPHGTGEAGLFIVTEEEFASYKESTDFIFHSLTGSHVQ